MNCSINGAVCKNDPKNRLTNTISRVAKKDSYKQVVLTGWVNGNSNEFIAHINTLNADKSLLNKDKIEQADLQHINQNKFRRILSEYYINHYKSVNNSRTAKGFGSNDGFHEAEDKKTAKVYNAQLLLNEYRKELMLPPHRRRTSAQIIDDVNRQMRDNLYSMYADDFAQHIITNPKEYGRSSKDAVAQAERYQALSTQLREAQRKLTERTNKRRELRKDINTYSRAIRDYNEAVRANTREVSKYYNPQTDGDIYKFLNNVDEETRTALTALMQQREMLLSKENKNQKRTHQGYIENWKGELANIENGVEGDTSSSIEGIKQTIGRLETQKYIAAQTLIMDYSDKYDALTGYRMQNYANLVEQSLANRNLWYFQVLHTSIMADAINQFENYNEDTEQDEDLWEVLDDDQIQSRYNMEDDIDGFSKGWENHFYRSVDQSIGQRLRMRISLIPKLTAPISKQRNEKTGQDDTVKSYDTNNGLGVMTYHDPRYVIAQIFASRNVNTVEKFISSIEQKTKELPGMYGIGELVEEMKQNRLFANEMFVNFSKPIVPKIQVTQNNKPVGENIEVAISNRNSDINQIHFLTMSNRLHSTYQGLYSQSDYDMLSKINKGQADVSELYPIVAKLCPNISKDTVDRIINSTNEKGDHENKGRLINALQDILNGVKDTEKVLNEHISRVNKINSDNRKDYIAKHTAWELGKRYKEDTPDGKHKAGELLYKEEPQCPPAESFDRNEIELNAKAYRGVARISNLLQQFSDARLELNSSNAEGETSSDVMKHCYISRFFDRLSTPQGRQVMLDEIRQGINNPEDANQYSDNPLFFGVKNEFGKIIVQGLFIRNGDNFTINESVAQDILSYSLFNGSNNTVNGDGKTFEKMSKNDYLISQWLMFKQSVEHTIYGRKQKGIGNSDYTGGQMMDSGVYSMRIGSDAPKIFLVRAPKYTTEQAKYAIYNHVISELQMFVTGLNSIVDPATRELISDVSRLDDNAFFDPKIRAKEGDIASLIDEKGRLRGNLFKFIRLAKLASKTRPKISVTKIISGGQTGIDTIGLQIAHELGYETGGTSPIGNVRESDDGVDITQYGVTPITQEQENEYWNNPKRRGRQRNRFTARTEQNVINSDGTIYFREGDKDSAGFKATKAAALDHGKPFYDVETQGVAGLRKWMIDNGIKTLNIAGNRGSGLSQEYIDFVNNTLRRVLSPVEQTENQVIQASDAIEQMLGLTDRPLFVKENGKWSLNDDYFNTETQAEEGFTSFITQQDTDNGTKFALNLTQEMRIALKDIVMRWADNYVQEQINKHIDKIELIRSVDPTFDESLFENFILNAYNMNMNYDDLFGEDFKFYKDSRTALKREKQLQAGGDGYAGYDVNEVEGTVHDLMEKNQLGEHPIQITLRGLTLNARNGYKAVTVANVVTAADFATNLQETLKQNYIDSGMDEARAEALSTKLAKGYYDTSAMNDGLSYITFEEFIRRHWADGSLDQYRDLIEQILDPNIPVEQIDMDKVNGLIQMQKNFYYDKKYDQRTGLFRGRQIKNAEFVIVPKLLPKGSDLIKIYNWMQKNKIDQLNTQEASKLSNRNVLQIWNEDGTLRADFDPEITDENGVPQPNIDPDAIDDFYYKYLYKQLDVKQHMVDARNKLTTQFMKKVIDNARELSPETAEAADNFVRAIITKVRNQTTRFLDNMGWQVNSDGSISDKNGAEISYGKFYQRLREETSRLGLDSNLMEYFSPNELSRPNLPMWGSAYLNKIEQVINAVANKQVTRIMADGWHAAQLSGVGYSDKLKFDPKTGIMEIYLPRWSSLLPQNLSPEEERALLEQLNGEGLLLQLGFRLPTEGKQSISKFLVKGLVNPALGSTVVVPNAWLVQTGSDFDVDSIVGIVWAMNASRNENGTLVLKKSPYTEDTVDNFKLYKSYMRSRIGNELEQIDESDELYARKKALYDKLAEDRQEADDVLNILNDIESELYTWLPDDLKQIIKDTHAGRIALAKALNQRVTKERLAENNRDLAKSIEAWANEEEHKDFLEKEVPLGKSFRDRYELAQDVSTGKEVIDLYVTSLNQIADWLEEKQAISENYTDELSNLKDKVLAEVRESNLETLNRLAEREGLMSYEEFMEQDLVDRLDDDGLQNYMLEQLMTIMKHPGALEEQYSRSNFDEIREAIDKVKALKGIDESSVSPYDVLTQVEYFDDVRSGADMKARSVVWDTFISVNNRVRAELGRSEGNDKTGSKQNTTHPYITAIFDNDGNRQYIEQSYKGNVHDVVQEERKEPKSEKDVENIKEIGTNDVKETISNLENSARPELSNSDKLAILRKIGKPFRVLTASEHTDPVFHMNKVLAQIEENEKKSTEEQEFQHLYIITKHDGLPLRKVLETSISKNVHFSITGLGGTKWEPGVMKPDDLLDRIQALIEDKVLNPNTTTVRIDPIIPNVTTPDMVRHIIDRAVSMGITKFKFSVMDSYATSKDDRFIKKHMEELGYNWEAYKDENGKIQFNANIEVIKNIFSYINNIADEYKKNGKRLIITTCAEKPNFGTDENGQPIKFSNIITNEGCLSIKGINNALGENVLTEADNKGGRQQRNTCSCYGHKTDALSFNSSCASSCAYCYAKHSSNKSVNYYNPDGTLKDNAFTRTAKEMPVEQQESATSYAKPKDGAYSVDMKKLGYSDDNRNVTGQLVTSYAGQTTAHHLDAVKAGSAPNVTLYTFNVYKMFSATGLSHEMAIMFMAQPAITRMVDCYNQSNSVFIKDDINPVSNAISQIMNEMGIVRYNKNGSPSEMKSHYSLRYLVDTLNENTLFKQTFTEMFGVAPSESFQMGIYQPALEQRLMDLQDGDTYHVDNLNDVNRMRKACHDIAVLLTFNNLNTTASGLQNIMQASRVDKIGNKPTIYENRKTVETVGRLLNNTTLATDGNTPMVADMLGLRQFANIINNHYNNEVQTRISFLKANKMPTKNDPRIKELNRERLEALSNPAAQFEAIQLNEASYESIAVVYKNVVLLNLLTNPNMIATESEEVYKTIRDLSLQWLGKQLNNKQYKEFRQYMINDLYNHIPMLLTPIHIDENGNIRILENEELEQWQNENKDSYWNAERTRICGYNVFSTGDFHIKNINHPTQAELKQFEKLTPAQKIIFIQSHFTDNSGLFTNLKIRTSSRRNGVSRQYIQYDDQIDGTETMLSLFQEAFSNKNPLIKLAAVDAIKYAFIGNGNMFNRGSLSKIIPNATLYTGRQNGGCGITDEMVSLMNQQYSGGQGRFKDRQFMLNYVRSHSDMFPTYTLSQEDNKEYLRHEHKLDKLIYINARNAENSFALRNLISHIGGMSTIDDSGHAFMNVVYQDANGKTVRAFYEVIRDFEGKNVSDIYMIPLNKLEKNEAYDYSYNPQLNQFNDYAYYDGVVTRMRRVNSKRTKDELGSSLGTRQVIEDQNEIVRERAKVMDENVSIPDDLNPRKTEFALANLAQHIQPAVAASAQHLINAYAEHLETEDGKVGKKLVVMQPSYMHFYFKNGQKVKQTLLINNEQVPVWIRRINMISGRLGEKLEYYRNNGSFPNVDRNGKLVPFASVTEELDVWQNHKESGWYTVAEKFADNPNMLGSRANIYAIEPRDVSLSDDATRNSETEGIVDPDEDASLEEIRAALFDPFNKQPLPDTDVVSLSMMAEISYSAHMGSAIGERFMNNIDRDHINRLSSESLAENRKNIYKYAATYYRAAANQILKELNGYSINGHTYSMDDEALYKKLAEEDSHFGELAKIILDGLTFGNRISDILNLDLATQDEETRNYIESIIASIRMVKNNTKLRKAMANMMNIYIAQYATNPLIVDGLLKVRDQFGDADWFASWIMNPTDVENEEVQLVLKKVYNILNKAMMYDAKEAVNEWKEKLKVVEAMPGNLDMSRVIDNKEGRLRQKYNENYKAERQRLVDQHREAQKEWMNDYFNDEKTEKYLKSKYELDKFLFEHEERQLEDRYYKRDLAARKEVIEKGMPLYIKYTQLNRQLFDENDEPKDGETEQERKHRIRIELSKLQSLFYTGPEDEPLRKSKEDRDMVEALAKYIKTRGQLAEEYYDSKAYDGFYDEYNRYKSYIDRYDEEHPMESLAQKMENPLYQEATDWINSNGRITFNKELGKRIDTAFAILRGHKTPRGQFATSSIKNYGLADESGIVDARKLEELENYDAVIDKIKEEEEKELAYAYGEPLFTFKPSDIPLGKRKAGKDWVEETTEDDKEYGDIAKKINKIILRAVDIRNNKFDIRRFFGMDQNGELLENPSITDEDRKELIRLVNQLKNTKVDKKKQTNARRYKKRVKTNDAIYAEHMSFARTELGMALDESENEARLNELCEQFRDLFQEVDDEGRIVPSHIFYQYMIPAKIDKARTASIQLLNNHVAFTKNKYYYMAAAEHQEKGDYEEWFEKNHVYNPYSHMYQPLSIWTNISPKVSDEAEYTASYENTDKYIKPEKRNKNYRQFGSNYREGCDSRYNNDIALNDKEKAMRDLLDDTMSKYATTYKGKKFVGEGFLPRERQSIHNMQWYATQVASMFGVSYHSGVDSENFSERVEYETDRDSDFDMLNLIKAKGSRSHRSMPLRGMYKTDEDYNKAVDEVRKENEEIDRKNLEIDELHRNNNWLEIMEDFVHNATIFNSKQATKPYLYLLLEDLKDNNAYAIKGLWDKSLVRDRTHSTQQSPGFRTVSQQNTWELVHNFARRVIRDEHHEPSQLRNVMNFLQNMASAKFMVANVYGGVNNVTIGLTNILMEEFANEYFGFKEFNAGMQEYLKHATSYLATAFSEKSLNLTTALIKRFNVVDMDEILQFGAGSKNLDERLKNYRDSLYAFQSMGEHFMQNSGLLAMLKSNKLYLDPSIGKYKFGDIKDYTQDVENVAIHRALEEYGDEDLLKYFDNIYLKKTVKNDLQFKMDVSTGRKNINRNFLLSLRNSSNSKYKEAYDKIRESYAKHLKEYEKQRTEDFNKCKSIQEIFEFKNGTAEIKPEYAEMLRANGYKNPEEALQSMIADFKQKVIEVNHKIHGVYDKYQAAMVEKKWFGSVMMQYKKHLPWGFMKRWRRQGYYSEFRGGMERGAYQQLIDFMGMEFLDFKNIKNEKVENGTNVALAALQTTMECVINTVYNMRKNWQLLAPWERRNMARIKGDLVGILAPMAIAAAIHALWDDDEIHDSRFLSSLLYIADRQYSEASMYTPIGAFGEAQQTWSSPIASANGPSDLLKLITILPQYIADPEYRTYKQGMYKGRDRIGVIMAHQIPAYRPIDRIKFITRNNKYYKVGESQIGLNLATKFGDYIGGYQK